MQSQVIEQHGVRLKCPNTTCAYEWTYKGRFVLYSTCPACRRNIRILENKVKTPQSPQVRGHVETEAFSTPGVDPRR